MSDSPDHPLPTPVEWNPPVPGSTWTPTGAVPTVAAGPTVEIGVGPAGEDRRPRGKRIALIVGVVALIAAAIFAVTALVSRDEGGASSPEGAVEAMVGAINDADLLGVLDVLLPGERRTLREPLVDITAQLRRLGILATSADLGSVKGVETRIDAEGYDVDQVADDIANVTIEGVASIHLDASKVPLGPAILDDLLDGEEPTGTVDEEVELGGRRGANVQVTTVKQGGRWYVSLGFTIAELARAESGADVPGADEALRPRGADEALRPRGADSPEAAVEQILQALSRLDLEVVLASLDPGEFGALQRYAPIFLDDAQDEFSRNDVDISIDDLSFDTERHGDSARVGLRGFTVSVTVDGQTGDADFDGECLSIAADGEEHTGCAADAPELSLLSEVSSEPLEPEQYLAFAAKSLAESHPVKVTKVGGEWYVSVLGSVFDSIVTGLEKVEPDDVTSAIENLRALVEGD